ncbi:MAG: BRO-N domain-containing protein, partial [Paraclostridium sp.]
ILRHVDASDKIRIKNSNVVKTDFRKIHNTGETFINESGLYSLILSSELDSAKKFKHWVTSEVLPMIRKTGNYVEKKDDSLGDMIQSQLVTIIDNKLNEKIANYKANQIEELVKIYRAYGLTKKQAGELAYKTLKLNSTVDSIYNGYIQQIREEDFRRQCGQIKAYIKDLTKLGISHQDAWMMFADEVLYKTGYDLVKTRSYLKQNGKTKATFLDAATQCGVLKDAVSIVKRLANRTTKEYNRKTA